MEEVSVTVLLQRARSGDVEAFGKIFDILYSDLRAVARNQLAGYQRNTLNTHALIHESYLRLAERGKLKVEDRVHFLALSSRVMRQIIVDGYRRQKSKKRGGHATPATLSSDELPSEQRDEQVLELDEALVRLQAKHPRLAQVVEYKYFGGMTYDDIASALNISPRTARQDWRKAKAWLRLDLDNEAGTRLEARIQAR